MRGLITLAALALLAVVAVTGCGGDSGPLTAAPDDPGTVEADYEYVIPDGTADRLAQGEVVEIMPSTLTVRVGEVLVIRNQDRVGQQVGPFWVGAGETLTQRFSRPGRLEGACVLQPSGKFIIDIVG